VTTYVALLRGINVGKAKRIAMADLRDLCGTLGYTNVRTLLNSGNLVFDAPTKKPGLYAKRLHEAILETLGVDTFVVVKSGAEITATVNENPLAKLCKDPSRLLVAFANDATALTGLAKLVAPKGSSDALALGKQAAFIWCEDGILKSPLLASAMKTYGALATARNWATVIKLGEMVGEK
jgi:uncharacterized protein (DUF1697 family)